MECGRTVPSPSPSRRCVPPNVADVLALLHIGAVYWLRIYPQVGRELAGWQHRASCIPDLVLRQHALAKLSGERLNPEAAALFAVLAPSPQRRRVVRLIVAYQVLYDYLDAVNEDADGAELRNGLQLHRALTDAVLPELPMSDYYLRHPSHGDGGYVRALVIACRRIVRTLPSAPRCAAVLARTTERCGQAQSRNHAILTEGDAGLIRWSRTQASEHNGYLWWELAAGGISCLAIHALLAVAADPRGTAEDAAKLDAAYFPPVCAISALLDSLADYEADAGTTNHSFVERYRDSDHAATRLVSITADATQSIRTLPHAPRHAVILAGICSYYLSSPTVWRGFGAQAAQELVSRIGPLSTPMRGAMRVRRRMHARGKARPIPGAPTSPARARRHSPAPRAPAARRRRWHRSPRASAGPP